MPAWDKDLDSSPWAKDLDEHAATPQQQEAVRQFVRTPAPEPQHQMPPVPVYHQPTESSPFADWVDKHGEGLIRGTMGAGVGLLAGAVTKSPLSTANAAYAGQDIGKQMYDTMIHDKPVDTGRLARAAAVGASGGLGGMLGTAGAGAMDLGAVGSFLTGTAGAAAGAAAGGAASDAAAGKPIDSVGSDAAMGAFGHVAGGLDSAFKGAVTTSSLNGASAAMRQYFTGVKDLGVSPADMVDRNEQTPLVKEAVSQLAPEERARLAQSAANDSVVTPTKYSSNDSRRKGGLEALSDLSTSANRQYGAAKSQFSDLEAKGPAEHVPVPPVEPPKQVPPPAAWYPARTPQDSAVTHLPDHEIDAQLRDYLSKHTEDSLKDLHQPVLKTGPDLPPEYLNSVNAQKASLEDQMKRVADPDAKAYLERQAAGLDKEAANRSKIFNDEVNRSIYNRDEFEKERSSWNDIVSKARPESELIDEFLNSKQEPVLQSRAKAHSAHEILQEQENSRAANTEAAAKAATDTNSKVDEFNANRDQTMQDLTAKQKELEVRREALARLAGSGKTDDAISGGERATSDRGLLMNLFGRAKEAAANQALWRPEAPVMSERLLGNRILNGASTAPTVRLPVGGGPLQDGARSALEQFLLQNAVNSSKAQH